MKFKVNGVELAQVDSFRVRELIEAEKALGLSMDDTGYAGRVAIALFVALRRGDPERHAVEIADEVMATDFEDITEEEEQGPPAEGDPDVASPPISGRPPSALSA